MAERDDLLRAVQAARSGPELAAAVAALDGHDQARTAAIARSRETDMSATAVRETLAPLPAFERHTAATDWLGDYEAPSDFRTAMIAEAARWYRSIPPGVAADRDEFQEQALGRAYTAASAYGNHALDARRQFMEYVGYLARQGASGLPQIQQAVDPHDNPAATPLPPEPFDNFAPEQNELNAGVESPNRQSQISSDMAPGIQELERQDAGGSGFGSGPEKPDEHSTSMDTSNSYAEVPLGPPGQIPTAAPGPAPSAPSAANPAMGMDNMDEGSQQRQTAARRQAADSGQVCAHCREGECASCSGSGCTCNHPAGGSRQGSLRVSAYTGPDSEGFRWHTGSDQDGDTFVTPYHERCGSLHWPEQACHNGSEHTASVAVGYLMSMEDLQRQARSEALGMAEGDLVLRRAAGDMARVAAHHDAIAAAFRAEARTDDEIAWLHGYLARVRPLLARRDWADEDEENVAAGWKPKARNKRKKKKGKPRDEDDGVKAAASRLDFPEAPEGLTVQAETHAPYYVTGEGPYKVVNSIGETKGTHGSYDEALEQQRALYKRVPGAREKAEEHEGEGRPAAVKEEGPKPSQIESSMRKGAPFAGYTDFADCQAKNSDKDDSAAYCGYIKHKTEDKGKKAARIRLTASDLAAANAELARFGASSLPQIQETVDSHDNPDPGGDQLNTAVMFPLNPAFGGEGEQSKEAARSSMRPSNRAIQMFGHMDAMEGKPPPHKDSYVFGVHGHGVYLRAHNETRGVIDAINDRDPVTREKYAEQTGRPDLHSHYLGVYSEMKARRAQDLGGSSGPAGRAWSNEPGGYQASLQRQADLMTRPHQSTDDLAPPYNSEQTSPDPWSSNEQGGDYAQGMKDGQDDAAAGERPTFSDSSSRVSPYVKGYAVGYSGRPGDAGVPDVPRSMGGDSGQPRNSADAQRAFQVSKASLQRQGAGLCYGCPHLPHLGQPCGEEGCRHLHNPGEEGAGPGMHARQIGHVPDPEHPGYSKPREGVRHQAHDFTESERENAEHSLGPEHKLPVDSKQDLENAHTRAHQVEGIPESRVDAYLSRLDKEYDYHGEDEPHEHEKRSSLRQVSAAFLTAEAVRHPDFRKGYKYAARWRPGTRMVSRGSAAFEAGLYAAIADRPGAQEAWVQAHMSRARRYPRLGERIEAHASFSRQFAASDRRYQVSGTGCYLVQTAGTSTDLITDGPGTSPDPMGSTPLNGPGRPPPMGGGEDPARSGGPSPYQGSEPQGSGPVAPDDVIGQPQEPPQESGPFTQTFSGRQPGNADLAPVAPNTAGGPGYENTDAYQGNPARYQQAVAFRQRVQASLAARRAG
jgi:hypothetical protein